MTPLLTIKFDLPDEVANGFPSILNNMRKHVVRQSIRSALSPCRAALKTRVMAITRNSRQSTGATSRAIDQKYGQNKKNANRFYGMISVNRKYIEAAVPEEPVTFKNMSRYRQVAFGIRRRRPKPGQSEFLKRYPRQEVRSFYRRSLKRDLKRRPSRYLHLIEFGFNHYKAGPVEGYRMIQETQRETEAQAVAIFRSKALEHFRRIFK